MAPEAISEVDLGRVTVRLQLSRRRFSHGLHKDVHVALWLHCWPLPAIITTSVYLKVVLREYAGGPLPLLKVKH